MYFYQILKHHPNDFTNDCTNDENYVCNLTMKASVVLALLRSKKYIQKLGLIDLSKEEIALLVERLEEYIKSLLLQIVYPRLQNNVNNRRF